MYNVLLILLHRPFVSDGHLKSDHSNVIDCFAICTDAATNLVQIVRAYDRAFSIRRAPYLISYATYVSATIHVRIAAQRERGSEAHACLATCLDVFKKNEETNWAVRRANFIIQNLMKRMQVSIQESDWADSSAVTPVTRTSTSRRRVSNSGYDAMGLDSRPQELQSSLVLMPMPASSNSVDNMTPGANIDIDAIIQSFIGEQSGDSRAYGARNEVGYPPAASSSNVWSPSTYGIPPRQAWTGQTYSYSVELSNPTPDQDGYHEDFSANDMLFGFNSAAMEGMEWDLDGGGV